MTYTIIPDSELSVNNLMNNEMILFTETEMKNIENTSWVKYNITGQAPKNSWEKIRKYEFSKENIDFLIELGYTGYAEVISLDNTLKKALESRSKRLPIEELTMEDFQINKKINNINMLSHFITQNTRI